MTSFQDAPDEAMKLTKQKKLVLLIASMLPLKARLFSFNFPPLTVLFAINIPHSSPYFAFTTFSINSV